MEINKKDMGQLNSIFPITVQVVGSYNENGTSNIMTASFAGIVSMNPVAMYVSLRKATLTYDNIIREKAFTVNTPSRQFIAEADYVGIVSGKKVDKFEATGLTPVKSSFVNAPYIAEFPVIYECKLIEVVEVGMHTMFIGEIVNAKADESILNEKGKPALDKIQPIVMGPGENSYFGIGENISKAFHYKDAFPRKEEI